MSAEEGDNTQAAEMKPVVAAGGNEPVESGAAKAAEAAAMVSVSPIAFTALAFVALVLLVVGTPLPWLRSDVTLTSYVSLWETKSESTTATTIVKLADQACGEYKQYFRTAEAFAVTSIGAAALMVCGGVAAVFGGKPLRVVGGASAAVTFAVALVAWATVARAYYKSFCGQPTYDAQRYSMYAGAGVFVAGWVFSLVALAVSMTDVKVPKALPEAAVDKFVAAVFTLLAACCLVFSAISTPISIVSLWTSTTSQIRISIWYYYTYTNDVMTVKKKLTDMGCGTLDRYALLTQAFTTMTPIAALIAVVCGVLAIRGTAGTKTLLLAGLLPTATGVIATCADLAIYYKQFCTALPSLDSLHLHRDAGVALIATAALVMAAGLLLVLVVAVARLCSKKPEGGNVSVASFVFLIGTVVSVLFTVISLATPIFSRDDTDINYTKVFWWRTETRSGATFTVADFTCQAVWERLIGGASLGIAATSICALGAILGIAQLLNASLRTAASATTLVAALAQLVAFALAMDVYQGHHCSGSQAAFYNSGYDYAVGFGLMVAAFCVNVVVSVLNLVVSA
jgi:hypothetical protein